MCKYSKASNRATIVAAWEKNLISFSIIQLEPVATKKPKFSSDAKFTGYERVRGDDLTLLCPAQGFPVPSYRYMHVSCLKL